MRKFAMSLLCILITVAGVNATPPEKKRPVPTDANIIGHVVDATTKEHIPGITIQIKGTNFGTSTDATGHYFLRNVRPGTITLIMRGVGYLSQEKTVVVEKNKVVEVNFEAYEDAVNIDEVVVTANRQATLRRLAPTIVNVVGEEVFSRVNANNLAQGIIFQPGVRVENNCQNCGFNQVRINGLDGRYTQILIDSRPIFSALAGVYGIEQIPTNMIDRVEVVRGGGSALFGSSAIGGVVNIITKEPVGNSFSFGESLTFTGMKNPDNNISMNASLVSDDNKAGAMIFGQTRYRQEWDANNDGYSELGRLNSRSLGTRAFLRTTDYTKLTAEFHTIQEYRRGGDHIDWPDHVASISEHVDHSIFSSNAKFDAFSSDYKHHLLTYISGQIVNRKSYYGGIGELQDDKGNTLGQLGFPIPAEQYGINFGVSKGNTYMGGLQYSYDFDRLLFMPAQVLIGAEYVYDHLSDVMPLRNWLAEKDSKGNLIELFPKIDQKINNWSQLAQIEWKNDMFSILLGARLDENSAVGKPIFSPRATLRYNPTKNVNFRLSYAKGFRAPQVFDEDLHVGVVNGEVQKVYNIPDLRPETSHSINASADLYAQWGPVKANLLIEGFYNKLQDVFVTKLNKVEHGIMMYDRKNGEGATVYGANLEGKLTWSILQLQGGLTLTQNRYDKPEEWGQRADFLSNGFPVIFDTTDDLGNPIKAVNQKQESDIITRTPSAYGYFTLGITPVKNFDIALTGTITGPMYVPHAIKYGSTQQPNSGYPQGFDEEGMQNYLVAGGLEKDTEIRIDELKKTPTFFDMGFKLSYDFDFFSNTCLQVYAGMNNLLNAMQSDYDKGADRDSGYIYGPTMPRSAFLGMKLSF
ncbi:TonB-dependent receptor [uncultured Porphyromonas sp.]|uniref:TonB-dependent receptor n=1 Tax=uncultured Porphyromonas sp. TaxID=159274 RepID=UPI00261A4A9E|nr:TonB-dependent receptor [uncultured Porphyromonas sp.]